jgi:hypothetical protein
LECVILVYLLQLISVACLFIVEFLFYEYESFFIAFVSQYIIYSVL